MLILLRLLTLFVDLSDELPVVSPVSFTSSFLYDGRSFYGERALRAALFATVS